MQRRNPHAKNVPGDFYVENECCTSCGIPFDEAPGHFQYDEVGNCFVRRQPATPDEVRRMINAVHASEMKCIRYAGTEPDTLQRLVAVGETNRCDALPEEPEPPPKDVKKVWWALWRR
jgi:hypothetical protein